MRFRSTARPPAALLARGYEPGARPTGRRFRPHTVTATRAPAPVVPGRICTAPDLPVTNSITVAMALAVTVISVLAMLIPPSFTFAPAPPGTSGGTGSTRGATAPASTTARHTATENTVSGKVASENAGSRTVPGSSGAASGAVESGAAGRRAGWADTPEQRDAVSLTWPLTPRPEVVRPFDPPDDEYGPGHRGVDLAAEPGQPVSAAATGRVLYAGELAGRGVVSVEHRDGLRTTYEPVSVSAEVDEGDLVAAGRRIGTVTRGHAGCPASACLHWGLRRGEQYLNPLTLVATAGPLRLKPWPG